LPNINHDLSASETLPDGKSREYPHYWYKFTRDGRTVRVNTKQTNKRTAEDMENAHRTKLAQGDADLLTGKSPTLATYAATMPPLTSKTGKVKSTEFYADRLRALLEFAPLANARLSHIDTGLVEQFKAARLTEGDAISSINGCLRTLRKTLGAAQDQKPRFIAAIPKIRVMDGAMQNDFILKPEDQAAYLAACPDPLQDIAGLIVETGLRLGEAIALTWADI